MVCGPKEGRFSEIGHLLRIQKSVFHSLVVGVNGIWYMLGIVTMWEDDTAATGKSFGCDLLFNTFDMVEESDTVTWVENKINLWRQECEI